MHAPTSPEITAAEHVEDALDEALEESFPASDPIAISDGKPARRTPPSPASDD